MKKILLVSLLFFSGCDNAIDFTDGSSVKIIQVTKSTSDENRYFYRVQDKTTRCYYFVSEERFLVGDSVKLVKVELE